MQNAALLVNFAGTSVLLARAVLPTAYCCTAAAAMVCCRGVSANFLQNTSTWTQQAAASDLVGSA